MSVHTETVRYGAESACSGYLAYPDHAQVPLPAILVLQEAWGVDNHIEDMTRRFAAAGYAALAPDLYSDAGIRPKAITRERVDEMLGFMNALPPSAIVDPKVRDEALAKLPAAMAARVSETRQTIMGDPANPGLLSRDWLPQLMAATRYLREECPRSHGQKVAAVGFSMGGGLSALLACHDPELAGAVVFYGMSPPAELVPKIRCPILGFYAGTDQRIGAGLPEFTQAMQQHGKRYEKHIFDGVLHSFFNDTRPPYDVRAAREAFARTLDFFWRTLA